jgi:SLOG cluster2
MSENIIAISVSDGPDLQVFGFLPQQLFAFLSGAISREGWRVGYGGDLRRDGFTRPLLADMAAAYARGEIIDKGKRRSCTSSPSRLGGICRLMRSSII